jgi:hypothetical protein
MKMIKLLVPILLFSWSLFSQNNLVADLVPGNYTNDWELSQSFEKVDIFTKYSDCSDPTNGFYPEQLLIKVTNKTNQKVYLYWEYETAYDGVTSSSSTDERLVQIQLEPKQTIEGSCKNLHENRLGVFVRYIGKQPVLNSLILSNINIYKLN